MLLLLYVSTVTSGSNAKLAAALGNAKALTGALVKETGGKGSETGV